jgi:hypothetical protein
LCPYDSIRDTDTQEKEGGHVETETEVPIMLPQAQEIWSYSQARREDVFSQRGFGRNVTV